jgi:hypothetical protein
MNKQQAHEASRKDVIDVTFYKSKRSQSAKARAARQKAEDPEHFSKLGNIPKRFTETPRGFGAIDPSLAREIQAKGREAYKAKRESK